VTEARMQQRCNAMLIMCVLYSTVALLLYTSAILYANNIDYTQVLSSCCHFATWKTCCAPFVSPIHSCYYQEKAASYCSGAQSFVRSLFMPASHTCLF